MRKNWLLSVVFMVVMVSANAQFRKIPAGVTDAFKAKYSEATSVSWRDRLSSFQADFKIGEKDMRATFSSKGEWVKTESKYNANNLPAEVIDGLKKSKYADLPVQEVTQIDEKEKGILYKLVVKKGEVTKKTLVFTSTGQLVSDNSIL